MKPENEITKQQILSMQIIAIALMAGPTIFLLVTAFLSTVEGSPSKNPNDSLIILTPMAVGLSLLMSIISPFIQRISTKNAKSQSGASLNDVQKIQTGLIVRYALSEGPAFFGIVVLFLAVQSKYYPIYIWANLIPLAILYAVIFWTFPTKESVLSKLKEMNNED